MIENLYVNSFMLIYRLITTLDRNNLLEFPQNHATLQQGIWSRSFFLFYFLLLLSPFERSLLTLKDVLLIPCVQVMSYSSKLVNLLLLIFFVENSFPTSK